MNQQADFSISTGQTAARVVVQLELYSSVFYARSGGECGETAKTDEGFDLLSRRIPDFSGNELMIGRPPFQ